MPTLTQPLPLTVATLLSLIAPLSAQERQAAPFPLWNPEIPLPPAGELPQLRNHSFHVIKAWDRKEDGYTFRLPHSCTRLLLWYYCVIRLSTKTE